MLMEHLNFSDENDPIPYVVGLETDRPLNKYGKAIMDLIIISNLKLSTLLLVRHSCDSGTTNYYNNLFFLIDIR